MLLIFLGDSAVPRAVTTFLAPWALLYRSWGLRCPTHGPVQGWACRWTCLGWGTRWGPAVPCCAGPGARRRVHCGGGSPGDLKCLVLPGDAPAASRCQVNTGDAAQPRGARPDPAAKSWLPRPSPAFGAVPALPRPRSQERGHVPAGKGMARTPRVPNSCSCSPHPGTTAMLGARARSRGQPHCHRPSSRRPGHPLPWQSHFSP